MGLDAVEMVMAVEEVFEIRIEDHEAEKIFTPRQLIDLVLAKVANVETEACLTHRAFNLLRSFLVSHLGFSRSEITPKTRLVALFPRERRREFLREFKIELGGGSAPGLVAPGWLQILMVGFALAVGFAVATPVALHFGADIAILPFLVAAFVAAVGAMFLSRACATEFPDGITTLGDLSLWIRSHKPDLAAKSQTAWTREQVAARIREIVIDTLGCEKNYREDARFIEDLGLS